MAGSQPRLGRRICNDFSFDKPVGSKGVVKTEYGYHYIEILGQKNLAPAYKIAYLAKPIVASNETISVANTAAAQFVANTKNSKQFNENAIKQNLQVMSATEIKQNDFTINSFVYSTNYCNNISIAYFCWFRNISRFFFKNPANQTAR